MNKLGKEHVMGVAFGNELDDAANHASVQSWWGSDGKYVQTVKARVKELDDAGFTEVPITSAWTAGIGSKLVRGNPLGDTLLALDDEYKDRWVWAHNPYSLWSPGMPPTSSADCRQHVDAAVDIGFIKTSTRDFRDKIQQLIGRD